MKKSVWIKSFKMLSFAFLLTVCSVRVSAEEPQVRVDVEDSYVYQDGYIGEEQPVLTRTSSKVQTVLLEGLTNLESSIDIRAYNITTDQITGIYNEVINNNPNLFYTRGGYSYYYSGNIITSIVPKYQYPVEEIPSKIATYEAEMTKILKVVDSRMSSVEKLLALHDFLVADIEYGYIASANFESYSAYGAIVNKVAVCNGYTLAFSELCKRIGVESFYVQSVPMNHAWNMVKLDGQWYHVDTTWDDPTVNKEGRVRHSYFLISDEDIIAKQHYNWSASAPKATSVKYDNEFWQKINTKMIYNNTKWYFVESVSGTSHDIKTYSFADKTNKTIKNISSRWQVWDTPNSYWLVSPMLATYNNKLYYNTNDKIVNMNFDGSGVVEYSPDVSTGYIYGMAVHGNTMVYELAKTPNGAAVAYKYGLSNSVSRTIPIQKEAVIKAALQSTEFQYEVIIDE